MMNTLKDFIIYVFEQYPNPFELSKARLVKILYLADWKYALQNNQQLTKIDWFFNHYGPYVDDVMTLVKSDSNNFRVEVKSSASGSSREVVYLMPNHEVPVLTAPAKSVLDFVIKLAYPLYWDKFIELVYSTYPIRKSVKYSSLDLIAFAQEYRKNGSYKEITIS